MPPVNTRRTRDERLYAALLRAYPRRHREQYSDALMDMFRHRRDERLRSSERLGVGFWLFILRDLFASGWKERREPLESNGRGGIRTDPGGDGMKGWVDDLAYASRRLWRSPGFSATALVILVLAIGVNSTAFSVVNALLFQAPPFADPDAIVDVLQDSDDGRPNSTSFPAFQDIARTPGVFASVGAVMTTGAFLEQDGQMASITVQYTTSHYLPVLGLSPSRGRWFDESEDEVDAAAAAVISHHMWQDRFGGDLDIIGTTLRIAGGSVTVVGVGPTEYNGGVGPATNDLWMSISAMKVTGARWQSLTRRQDHPFVVTARLLDGVSVDAAQIAMTRLAEDLAATYPELNTDRKITVLPLIGGGLSPDAYSTIAPAAALVMTLVGLVLLIATLNLTNLLLVRTAARAREIAVRLAMGAGRRRLIRVVVSEALVLAALGGVGGLAMAFWVTNALSRTRVDLGTPITLDIQLDPKVLAFTAAVSIVAGLLFGLVPALRVTSRDVTASLRDDARERIGARRRFGLTGGLVAGQVAVSLLLLAVASVFLESLVRARVADPGMAYGDAGYLQVSLLPLGVGFVETQSILGLLQERLEALPAIKRVTVAAQLPAAQRGSSTLLVGSGVTGIDKPTEVPWNVVPPNYFDVLEIPIVHGRSFADADAGGAEVAIVSEAMALAYWGRTDLVGEFLRSENAPNDPVEIVGVVGDVTVQALGEAPTPSFYRPLGQWGAGSPFLVVRASGPVPSALGAAAEAVRAVDGRILILRSSTLENHFGDTLQRRRIAGVVLTGLGGLALVLAVLGVYGVVSFSVSHRKREVGIRIALGAGSESVVRLFIRDVAVVVVGGAIAGLAISLPASRFVGQQFTGGPGSPWLIAAIAAGLIATALVATLAPALRAARTDPTNTLRQE